jgi:hypothetical protein
MPRNCPVQFEAHESAWDGATVYHPSDQTGAPEAQRNSRGVVTHPIHVFYNRVALPAMSGSHTVRFSVVLRQRRRWPSLRRPEHRPTRFLLPRRLPPRLLELVLPRTLRFGGRWPTASNSAERGDSPGSAAQAVCDVPGPGRVAFPRKTRGLKIFVFQRRKNLVKYMVATRRRHAAAFGQP